MGAGTSTRKEPGYGYVHLIIKLDEEKQYAHVYLVIQNLDNEFKLRKIIRENEIKEYTYSNKFYGSNIIEITKDKDDNCKDYNCKDYNGTVNNDKEISIN